MVKPPNISKLDNDGEVDVEAIISLIRGNKSIPKRVMVHRKKVFCSELKAKNDVSYFLIENDGKAAVEVVMEFTLDGFELDDPDDDDDQTWTMDLIPGATVLKIVRPVQS